MTPDASATPYERLADRARAWGVTIDATTETQSSLIAYGSARGEPVVLKVVKRPGDEWRAGGILAAFNGKGAVRVHQHAGGATLLERAIPGDSLAALSAAGRDDEATDILAATIDAMSAGAAGATAPSAEDWGRSFGAYEASGDTRIPRQLVVEAGGIFARLCASQTKARLLHGDLQHYNVVRDHRRGWLAIDPKGVVAEAEYEIGAVLRNPFEQPALFLDQSTIERRVGRFASSLALDAERILAWGFAQAVLSAVWDVEDGLTVDADHRGLRLASVLRPTVVTDRH